MIRIFGKQIFCFQDFYNQHDQSCRHRVVLLAMSCVELFNFIVCVSKNRGHVSQRVKQLLNLSPPAPVLIVLPPDLGRFSPPFWISQCLKFLQFLCHRFMDNCFWSSSYYVFLPFSSKGFSASFLRCILTFARSSWLFKSFGSGTGFYGTFLIGIFPFDWLFCFHGTVHQWTTLSL